MHLHYVYLIFVTVSAFWHLVLSTPKVIYRDNVWCRVHTISHRPDRLCPCVPKPIALVWAPNKIFVLKKIPGNTLSTSTCTEESTYFATTRSGAPRLNFQWILCYKRSGFLLLAVFSTASSLIGYSCVVLHLCFTCIRSRRRPRVQGHCQVPTLNFTRGVIENSKMQVLVWKCEVNW